jgi:uncharacterized RDD family membrane protein YckC
VSRLVAFGADVGASWGLYSLGVALFNAAYKLVTGSSYNLTSHQVLALVILSVWEFVYYSYQWAVGGRTIGMAIFGLQVVTTEGGPIGVRQAVMRTLGLALSVAFFLFAFWGIIFQKERRALDDLIAGTAVVYSWDARAARLRWMARTESTMHGAVLHQQEQEHRLEPDRT